MLRIRQDGLNAYVELEIAGPSIGRIKASKGVQLDFGNGSLLAAGNPQHAINSIYGQSLIVQARLTPGDGKRPDDRSGPSAEFERQIVQIGIATSAGPLVIKTGKMYAALQALHKCADDMFTGWGISPSTRSELAQEPRIVDGTALARAVDQAYPKALKRPGKIDRVEFLAVVDANGVATGCHVTRSSEEGFNEHVCSAVLKARFKPARDDSGAPVAWYYNGAVVHHPG
ncbi:energy transducer TonB [Novosphingobium sp. BL-52-GroH]|uniref:energy transducer TonB n=1 Tax=Novosphingobium sp. BL-52-GroH TaxID=3349877 RepID=UPI00384EBFFE